MLLSTQSGYVMVRKNVNMFMNVKDTVPDCNITRQPHPCSKYRFLDLILAFQVGEEAPSMLLFTRGGLVPNRRSLP